MPCTFIKHEAPDLFKLLTSIFKYNLKLAETGITDLLIFKLTEYCDVNSCSNVEIYHAKQEFVYGADIDLFVEQPGGKFIWFALQAKVMNYKGVYKDLRIKKKSPQQWEKLLHNETTHGSKAYYLFYNGEYTSGLAMPIRSDCQGIPTLPEYGYGIVERQVIDTHFKAGATRATFNDFYPKDMDSLRKLLCCDHDTNGLNLYSYSDIHKGVPYFQVYPVSGNTIGEVSNRENPGSADVGASAPYRIIIRKKAKTSIDRLDLISTDKPIPVQKPLKFTWRPK